MRRACGLALSFANGGAVAATPELALDAYAALSRAKRLDVAVLRAGESLTVSSKILP